MTRRAVTKAMAAEILIGQGYQCAACKTRLEAGATPWHHDHITPLHLGGAHTIDNLRALCIPCHKVKTRREAGIRGKIRRIVEQGGLLKRKKNKREKAIDRMRRGRGMP